MTEQNINVMIVDDHPIVRQGVKSLLGVQGPQGEVVTFTPILPPA